MPGAKKVWNQRQKAEPANKSHAEVLREEFNAAKDKHAYYMGLSKADRDTLYAALPDPEKNALGKSAIADQPAVPPGTVSQVPQADQNAIAKEAAQYKPPSTGTPAQSPFEQLANSVAGMYLQQIGQMAPLISGQSVFGPNGATDQVIANAAAAVPGAAGQLQQAGSAEQQAAGPLQQAMAQYGNAVGQEALPTAQAMTNYGQAMQEGLQASPYEQILQSLSSEIPYQLSRQIANFNPVVNSSPNWLQAVLGNFGVGSSTNPGLTAPGATAPATKTTIANSQNPTTATQAGSGGVQNPNTPGG
jgi:hypothetical protein